MLTAKSRLPIREMLTVGLLPSWLKVWVYRLRGYRIGRGVCLGFGAVICGRDVDVGDHVSIGLLTAIRGQTIRLGAHVQIGAVTLIDTPHIEIGEGTKINEQVFVGGLQFPDSRFVVGRNCLIMQSSYINPCRSIVIGDDSGVGVDCLLIGHASWASKFEGYPVEFEPITIGNSVALAWRVTVLPGARIGDGAVIGANSLVNGRIAPRCLAVGSPARVVAKAPYFPRTVSNTEKEQYLRGILSELADYLRGHGLDCQYHEPELEVHHRGRHWRLRVEYGPDLGAHAASWSPDVTTLISLRALSPDTRRALDSRGVTWVDLEHKERNDRVNDLGEEAIHYLKRYGVRLFRARP